MGNFKVAETEYAGYNFKNRLEARWGVFFDACGAKWKYEPEEFELYNGNKYLPTFSVRAISYLNDKADRCFAPLYVDVKGDGDAVDINSVESFSGGRDCGIFFVSNNTNEIVYDSWKLGSYWDKEKGPMTKPGVKCEEWCNASMASWSHVPDLITLGELIQDDWFLNDSIRVNSDTCKCEFGINMDKMRAIKKYVRFGDLDFPCGAFPGINKYGEFAIFSYEYWDRNPTFESVDIEATRRAFKIARSVRFEGAEVLTPRGVRNTMRVGNI